MYTFYGFFKWVNFAYSFFLRNIEYFQISTLVIGVMEGDQKICVRYFLYMCPIITAFKYSGKPRVWE